MNELEKSKILTWLNYQETIKYIECDDRDSFWYQEQKIETVITFLNEIGYFINATDVNINGDYVTQYISIKEV